MCIRDRLIVAHTAAALAHRTVHRVVGTGAGGRVYVALLDELLFHVQLLLAQHPGKGSFCRRTGEDGVIQPLAAQLHCLIQTAFQKAQAQAQFCVAGCALLTAGPDVQLHAAVAQPCACLLYTSLYTYRDPHVKESYDTFAKGPAELAVREYTEKDLNDFIAVSYTHLDVYKRQL